MYGLIRTVVFLILTIICAYIIKKSKIINKKRWKFIMLLFMVVLCEVSSLFPFENSIITFSSPEKAYSYFNPVKDIELIVNGNETDFVIGSGSSFLILPKTDKGWKTSTGSEIESVCKKRIEGITVATIYKHRKHDDLYVMISCVEGTQNEISDNAGSEFYSIKYADAGESFGDYYLYLAHINISDKPYYITVNGEKFWLTEQ